MDISIRGNTPTDMRLHTEHRTKHGNPSHLHSVVSWVHTLLGQRTNNIQLCQLSTTVTMCQLSSISSLTAAAAKSHQSYPTPCNPIDGSPPGSPVPGILLARTLEWLPFPSPYLGKEKEEIHQSWET